MVNWLSDYLVVSTWLSLTNGLGTSGGFIVYAASALHPPPPSTHPSPPITTTTPVHALHQYSSPVTPQAINAAGVLFVHRYVPETRGLDLESIAAGDERRADSRLARLLPR